ncbi:MAG: aminotransferase class I/II-fold pyridoxal phosphate-dependent enzyme [Actinomycetota bacterium]
MNWLEWTRAANDSIRRAGRWREVRDFDATGMDVALPDGGKAVSFASNDYLGLTQHPAVLAGARDALDQWGAGSGSARLIVGSRPIHTRLEKAIAAWKDKDAALLFPNGFAANLGVLTTFGEAGVTIVSDELNHASIVDGCRMARARVAAYPHKDVAAAERLVAQAERAILVTDSVFSMDGDVAPLAELTEVCAEHGALMVVDEAHAVLGPHPEAAETDRIRVGTLSKFLGAMGGFAAADGPMIDLLRNRARPFIFTTASSPADAGAALAAIELLRSAEGARLIARLRELVDRVAPSHPSPIIPVVVGDERDTVVVAAALLERGYLVPAIRPPSVPPGSSRLRVTLSAVHSDEQVTGLMAALDDVLGEGWRG